MGCTATKSSAGGVSFATAWRRGMDTGSASFVPLAIAASSGETGGIQLICGGVTIRPGAGFDASELRRVLQVVRELA